jgi:uncharacterized protein YjbJ (UPF0337 family)
MNWDRVEGNWRQFRGKIRENWTRLTEDELDRIAGRRDRLTSKLQELYGVSRELAEWQIKQWERRVLDFDEQQRHSQRSSR